MGIVLPDGSNTDDVQPVAQMVLALNPDGQVMVGGTVQSPLQALLMLNYAITVALNEMAKSNAEVKPE